MVMVFAQSWYNLPIKNTVCYLLIQIKQNHSGLLLFTKLSWNYCAL